MSKLKLGKLIAYDPEKSFSFDITIKILGHIHLNSYVNISWLILAIISKV